MSNKTTSKKKNVLSKEQLKQRLAARKAKRDAQKDIDKENVKNVIIGGEIDENNPRVVKDVDNDVDTNVDKGIETNAEVTNIVEEETIMEAQDTKINDEFVEQEDTATTDDVSDETVDETVNEVAGEAADEAISETVQNDSDDVPESKETESSGHMRVCSHCQSEIDWTKLTAVEKAQWITKDLCPVCAAKQQAEKEAKKQRAANPNKPMSAYQFIRSYLEHATLSDSDVACFMEKDFSRQTSSFAYALLKPVDDDQPLLEQTHIAGHARYNRSPITINDKRYFITNHIYAKNIDKFRRTLVRMGAIDKDFYVIDPNAKTDENQEVA